MYSAINNGLPNIYKDIQSLLFWIMIKQRSFPPNLQVSMYSKTVYNITLNGNVTRMKSFSGPKSSEKKSNIKLPIINWNYGKRYKEQDFKGK